MIRFRSNYEGGIVTEHISESPSISPELAQKYDALKAEMRRLGKVAVAFSSGVDSTLLLKVAHDELGENAVAITAKASMVPAREVREAQEFCLAESIRHVVLDVDAFQIEGFAANPANRCYICKTALFGTILNTAANLGFPHVAEGTNTSDLGDYRPGLKALGELSVESPFLKANMSKQDVRDLSRALGLPTWDKPSYACLASRVPYGDEITPEKLAAAETAEDALIEAGFAQVRCRVHGNLARIEVPADQRVALMRACAETDLAQRIKAAGFDYVSIDAEGYQSGSLNRTL